jgi:hypothetical protein
MNKLEPMRVYEGIIIYCSPIHKRVLPGKVLAGLTAEQNNEWECLGILSYIWIELLEFLVLSKQEITAKSCRYKCNKLSKTMSLHANLITSPCVCNCHSKRIVKSSHSRCMHEE